MACAKSRLSESVSLTESRKRPCEGERPRLLQSTLLGLPSASGNREG